MVGSKLLGEKRLVLRVCAGERELRLEPTNEGIVTGNGNGNGTGSLKLHEVENKGKN